MNLDLFSTDTKPNLNYFIFIAFRLREVIVIDSKNMPSRVDKEIDGADHYNIQNQNYTYI